MRVYRRTGGGASRALQTEGWGVPQTAGHGWRTAGQKGGERLRWTAGTGCVTGPALTGGMTSGCTAVPVTRDKEERRGWGVHETRRRKLGR